MSFLYLLTDFSLKFIFLGIRIATPARFLGHLIGKFSPALYSEAMSVFEVEVCFLYAAEGWILFLYPIS